MITKDYKYKSKEDTEPDIDNIFDYMVKNKIDMQDYRITRYRLLNDSIWVMRVSLGIRIQYRTGIIPDIEALLKNNIKEVT